MHKKLPQSTVKLVLPSNESYESKKGCNRTLATVLWVPLNVSMFLTFSHLCLFVALVFLISSVSLHLEA